MLYIGLRHFILNEIGKIKDTNWYIAYNSQTSSNLSLFVALNAENDGIVYHTC